MSEISTQVTSTTGGCTTTAGINKIRNIRVPETLTGYTMYTTRLFGVCIGSVPSTQNMQIILKVSELSDSCIIT